MTRRFSAPSLVLVLVLVGVAPEAASQETPPFELLIKVEAFPADDMIGHADLLRIAEEALVAQVPGAILDLEEARLTLGVGTTCAGEEQFWVCALRASLVEPQTWLGPFGTYGLQEIWTGGGVVYGYDRETVHSDVQALLADQLGRLGATWLALSADARECWSEAINKGDLARVADEYYCNPEQEPRRRRRR